MVSRHGREGGMTELFPEPLRHELTRSQMDRILL